MNDDFERFRAHCFQFACGKLDPEETAWMTAMLERHPDLEEELAAETDLVSAARNALKAAGPLVSFEQIAQILDADEAAEEKALILRGSVSPVTGRPHPQSAWLSDLRRWVASIPGGGALAATAVVAVLATIQLQKPTDQAGLPVTDDAKVSGYRDPRPQDTTQKPMLAVLFNSGVTAGDLRVQLPEMHLVVESGPDAEGVYRVRVVEGSPQQAIERLRTANLVREAHLLDARSRDRF